VHWPHLVRKEIAAILFVVALVGSALFFYVAFPNFSFSLLSHWGFGPGWECSQAGQGQPVCIKKVPIQTENSSRTPSAQRP
jgi:hypothetical protein